MAKINILYDQTPESAKVPPPPPKITPCCECGNAIGPWWTYDGDVFCSEHAPTFLKRPADYNPDGELWKQSTNDENEKS